MLGLYKMKKEASHPLLKLQKNFARHPKQLFSYYIVDKKIS